MEELEVIYYNLSVLKKFYTDDDYKEKLKSLVDKIIKANKIFVFELEEVVI